MDETNIDKRIEEPQKKEESSLNGDQFIPELNDLSLFEPPPLERQNAMRGEALLHAMGWCKKDNKD